MSDVTILDEATDMTEFWLKTRIAELETENRRLREFVEDYILCLASESFASAGVAEEIREYADAALTGEDGDE